MDNLPKFHTYTELMVQLGKSWYDWAVQEVRKHFVQDLGARPQHGVDREDMKRVVGRMRQLWIYYTLKTMKIG